MQVPLEYFQAISHLQVQDEGQHLYVHSFDIYYIFCCSGSQGQDLCIHVLYQLLIYAQLT